MSDSDTRSEETTAETTDDRVRAAIDDLIPTVQAVNDLGTTVLLTGPATVQLLLQVEDAATPQEAVETTMRHIAHVGLDTFTFAVTDMLTGESHYVKAGQLVDLDDLETQTKDQAEEDEQA